jgi:hypothetical protein
MTRACPKGEFPENLGMMSTPESHPKRQRRLGLLLAFLLMVASGAWLGYGPHRRFPARFLAAAAARGLLCEGGTLELGLFHSSLRGAKVSLRGTPGVSVDIGRIDFAHWPLSEPRVSLEQAAVHLRGEVVDLLDALVKAWPPSEWKLAYRPLEVSYEHRLLGQVRLSGARLVRRETGFALEAARAQVGGFAWQDVRLFFEKRKAMYLVSFGAEQARVQLSCFPSVEGMSRFILDVPHGPARPLLASLGSEPGDEFAAALAAGTLSLDLPDDRAEPVRGRVQVVLDRWPLFAPVEAEPLLGGTLSLISNVVAAADGARWELPRALLTMPVFALAGTGSLELGPRARLVLEVEGERTCRQLRGFLPPSRELESVRQFLDGPKGKSVVSGRAPAEAARLWLRWDTGSGDGRNLRPELRFEPGCGLGPWPEAGT